MKVIPLAPKQERNKIVTKLRELRSQQVELQEQYMQLRDEIHCTLTHLSTVEYEIFYTLEELRSL